MKRKCEQGKKSLTLNNTILVDRKTTVDSEKISDTEQKASLTLNITIPADSKTTVEREKIQSESYWFVLQNLKEQVGKKIDRTYFAETEN